MKPQVPPVYLPAKNLKISRIGICRLQNSCSKRSKRVIASKHIADSLVQVTKQRVEVHESGTAIDTIHIAFHFDLARMTCGAGHSDNLETFRTGGMKADGKTDLVAWIGEIAVPRQTIGEERLSVPLL